MDSSAAPDFVHSGFAAVPQMVWAKNIEKKSGKLLTVTY